MATSKITVNIKIAWWFIYLYLPLISFTLDFIVKYIDIDAQVNEEKLKYWLNKSLRISNVKAFKKT